MSTTKILVCGACGRMGTRIIELAKNDKELIVVGGLEIPGHPGIGSGDPKVYGRIEDVIGACDVVIDFTAPGSTIQHLLEAKKHKKPVVVGTTGFSTQELTEVNSMAREMPLVVSPNMSVGINILFKLVADVAKAVPDYDVEILELHHNKKKDAPSGTADKLFRIIAKALGRSPESCGVYGRKGVVGERKKEEIGVMAIRAGDIVGDHTVFFAGNGERIELTHRAHSRDTLAAGALLAAKWLVKQNPGLYDMQDVLGMK